MVRLQQTAAMAYPQLSKLYEKVTEDLSNEGFKRDQGNLGSASIGNLYFLRKDAFEISNPDYLEGPKWIVYTGMTEETVMIFAPTIRSIPVHFYNPEVWRKRVLPVISPCFDANALFRDETY